MSGILSAPGFGMHYPNFSQNLTLQNPPATLPTQPYGLPAPSISNKFIEPMTNPVARSYVRATPFQSGWEENYAEGMPIFVCSRKSTYGSPSCLVATPAVINFYLEEGARCLHTVATTAHKRNKIGLIQNYGNKDHLYCDNSVEKYVETWNPYGVIWSIQGKGSESGLSGSRHADDYVFNCSVHKTADIINYWGNVNDGDRIGWTLGMKKNVNRHFIDPNGNYVGESRQSPEYFMQLVPVCFGTQGYSASHNRNYRDLNHPERDDIDYIQPNMLVEQRDFDMDMVKGEFIPRALDMTKETLKIKNLGADFYSFGAFYPVGVVNKGSRTRVRPSTYDLNLALRSNVKAQSLEKIQVFLGC